MGDALVEQAAVDAILAANFDAEKAFERLLSSSGSSASKAVPKTNVRETFCPPSKGKIHSSELCFTLGFL